MHECLQTVPKQNRPDWKDHSLTTRKTLEKVQPQLLDELEKGKSGIGLENLRRRLELLYYGQYNLEIKPDGEVHGAILKLRLE